MTLRRGVFIAVEGLDRAGKSTAVISLVKHLCASSPTVAMRFPDYDTPVGKLILAYLKKEIEMDDHAIHLLFAANRHEKRDEIVRLIQSGTSIVCDRYVYSGLAYSTAKGLNPTWCAHSDQRSGMPGPDLVLFLNVSPDVAAKRSQYGDDRYEQIEFQSKVRQVYNKLASMPVMRIIDANGTQEQVFKDMLSETDQMLMQHAKNSGIRHELGLNFAQNHPLDVGVEDMI